MERKNSTVNSYQSTTDSRSVLADFLWNIQPLNDVSVIPKIRRVPKKIKGSLRELLDRERQFEIAVLANPQAGSTEDERSLFFFSTHSSFLNGANHAADTSPSFRVIFNKKLGYRGEPKYVSIFPQERVQEVT
jgi:hypothetical protein